MQTYLTSAKNGGVNAIFIETLLPFGLTTARETVRINYNAWLRNNQSPGYTLIDYGDSAPGVTYDTSGHPDSPGYQRKASVALPVLNAGMPS